MKKRLPEISCRLDQADYHVHPDYSKDALGSIDDYCRKALELGLAEICFTTHYDRDPVRKDIDPFMRVDGKVVPVSEQVVETYIQDIRDADERYRTRGLSVKAGLEVDYAPHYESILKDELAGYELDYILGAVHCLDHMAITSSDEAPDCFRRKKMEDMVAEYFEVVAQAVGSGLFHAIAHLDIYRKYGLGFYGEGILTAHRGLVEPVLKIMANDNVGLEINTGVLRRGHTEPCPSLEIVDLALSLGVRLVALGSDAHKVDQLGIGIRDSFTAVRKLIERHGTRDKVSAD